MLFSVAIFIYFRIVHVFHLCTIVLMKGFGLRLFFPLKECRTLFQIDFLDPFLSEGPIKSLFLVCPSAVQHFYKKFVITFFRVFALW